MRRALALSTILALVFALGLGAQEPEGSDAQHAVDLERLVARGGGEATTRLRALLREDGTSWLSRKAWDLLPKVEDAALAEEIIRDLGGFGRKLDHTTFVNAVGPWLCRLLGKERAREASIAASRSAVPQARRRALSLLCWRVGLDWDEFDYAKFLADPAPEVRDTVVDIAGHRPGTRAEAALQACLAGGDSGLAQKALAVLLRMPDAPVAPALASCAILGIAQRNSRFEGEKIREEDIPVLCAVYRVYRGDRTALPEIVEAVRHGELTPVKFDDSVAAARPRQQHYRAPALFLVAAELAVNLGAKEIAFEPTEDELPAFGREADGGQDEEKRKALHARFESLEERLVRALGG